MSQSDYYGLGMFVGFGLWLVVAPKSVARFYEWFHRGKVKMPQPRVIRLVGVAWTILVFVVTAVSLSK